MGNIVDSWGSYPKVYNVGHPSLGDFFEYGPLRIEEKVDGSQISFGMFGGELRIRSRNRQFAAEEADNMFAHAAASITELAPYLLEGVTYRGEYLRKRKHNSLEYARIPTAHIVLFDIAWGYQRYMDGDGVRKEARRIGLEAVPILYRGAIAKAEDLEKYLETESYLGGAKVEGVVMKLDTQRFGPDSKPLVAKLVSERFREIHSKEWSRRHKNKGDIVSDVVSRYATEQRFEKAAQHLAEAGNLTGSARDIGLLIKELHKDIEEECAEMIKNDLWAYYRKHVLRNAGRPLPEWYKAKLLDGAFGSKQCETGEGS